MLDTRQTEKGPVLSAGYPAVERLIDTEDFSEINQIFEKAYKDLDQVARSKRGLKKSREAKKAQRSIELVMALFKELLEIKYRINAMLKQASARKV
jgi:hypothetical protein